MGSLTRNVSNVGFVGKPLNHWGVLSGRIWDEIPKGIIRFGDTVSSYIDNYPEALVKDLLWCRNYHMMLVREIEDKLLELSKIHELTIILSKNDI